MPKFKCLDPAHPCQLLFLFFTHLPSQAPPFPVAISPLPGYLPALLSHWPSRVHSSIRTKTFLKPPTPSSQAHTGLWHCQPPSISPQPLYCFATFSDHTEACHDSETRKLGFEPNKPGFRSRPSDFQALWSLSVHLAADCQSLRIIISTSPPGLNGKKSNVVTLLKLKASGVHAKWEGV